MKIITEPTVTVISSQKFHPHPDFPIPEDGDDCTKIGSFAAKGCYSSYSATGRSNTENQQAVLESLHGSVLEHIHIGVFITGITRGLSLELNRHRTFNISQRSTRYTAEEDGSVVLDPYYARLYTKDDIESELEDRILTDHLNSLEGSLDTYNDQVMDLIEANPLNLEKTDLRKWARGKARNLLPHALETQGTWTNNIRGWRWFIEARSDKHAEAEIRRLADVCLDALRKVTPLYFEDFKVVEWYDGIPVWKPEYTKV